MLIGQKDHRGIAMAVAIGFGGLDQTLHFVVSEILASSQIGVLFAVAA